MGMPRWPLEAYEARAPMVEKNLSPYLSQALAILNRTAGVPPSRIRATGFLQHKLQERHRVRSAGGNSKERPQTSARDSTR
jgi:hypothetical protein